MVSLTKQSRPVALVQPGTTNNLTPGAPVMITAMPLTLETVVPLIAQMLLDLSISCICCLVASRTGQELRMQRSFHDTFSPAASSTAFSSQHSHPHLPFCPNEKYSGDVCLGCAFFIQPLCTFARKEQRPAMCPATIGASPRPLQANGHSPSHPPIDETGKRANSTPLRRTHKRLTILRFCPSPPFPLLSRQH